MEYWEAILLMPSLFFKMEPYVGALKLMAYSFTENYFLTLIGSIISTTIWFIIFTTPKYLFYLLNKIKKGKKVIAWHEKNEKSGTQRTEKLLTWLQKKDLYFLFPIIIFILAALPTFMLPLPFPLIGILLVKITNYSKKGYVIFVLGVALKVYLNEIMIYGIF